MILSMTGFGHSVIDTESGQLSATIRSVNSRYLDIKIRGLHIEPKVEQNIRQLISENIIRGSVQVFFEIGKSSTLNNSYSFNKDRFEAIDKTIKMISQNYSYTINPGDFIHSSDLLLDNRSDDLNSDDIIKITNEAILQLNEMRRLEGDKILFVSIESFFLITIDFGIFIPNFSTAFLHLLLLNVKLASDEFEEVCLIFNELR